MPIQDHKHFLVVNRRWINRMEFACVPREGETNWACNYSIVIAKQWIRDRMTGVPLPKKKRPGRE